MDDITKHIVSQSYNLVINMSLRVAVIDIRKNIYPILMKMTEIEVVLLYGASDSEIDDVSVKSGCTKSIRKLEPSTLIKTSLQKKTH